MGRPKTSDKLKQLRGTAQSDYRPRKTPIVGTLTELPQPPAWLKGKYALAEYDRAGRLLIGLGGLTEAAISQFAMYAQLHGDILEDMAAGANVKPARTAQLLSFAKAFRLTGTATAIAPAAPDQPENPFLKFKVKT